MNNMTDIDSSFNTKKYKNNFDLLVITPSNFFKSLEKLSTHKKKYGINTKIVGIKNIFNGSIFPKEGKDKQEQIKYFIKNAKEIWKIKYVLLVGDGKQLPIRYVHNPAFQPEIDFIEKKIISDLYYADLYNKKGNFSSWDENGNGIFGEWTGKTASDKNLDLKPDLFIGRLPCRNNYEVKIMVKKIINYETKTYGKSWFNNVVAAGGDTYPEENDIYEGEIDVNESLNTMKKFNQKKFLASFGDLTNNGAIKIIKAINNGCGFLILAGHGNPIFWSTHLPNNKKKIGKISINHMHLLKNQNKFPICVTNGCRICSFDTSILNLFRHPKESWNKNFDFTSKCWGWSITRKVGGGAIATLGSTGLTYLKWDKEAGGKTDGWSYLMPRILLEYCVNKTDIIGDLWGKVIIDYLRKYPIDWNTPSICYDSKEPKAGAINARTIQGFILFGDPTLKIGGYRKVYK